jgi:hypothetical protein
MLSPFPSVRYNLVMSASANSRASAAAIVFGLLATLPAHAQTFTGFNTLPYFRLAEIRSGGHQPLRGLLCTDVDGLSGDLVKELRHVLGTNDRT